MILVNRSDRKLARLKYTIDNLGVEKYKEEVEKRTGFKLEPAKPFTFSERKIIMAGTKDRMVYGITPCLWKMAVCWMMKGCDENCLC